MQRRLVSADASKRSASNCCRFHTAVDRTLPVCACTRHAAANQALAKTHCSISVNFVVTCVVTCGVNAHAQIEFAKALSVDFDQLNSQEQIALVKAHTSLSFSSRIEAAAALLSSRLEVIDFSSCRSLAACVGRTVEFLIQAHVHSVQHWDADTPSTCEAASIADLWFAPASSAFRSAVCRSLRVLSSSVACSDCIMGTHSDMQSIIMQCALSLITAPSPDRNSICNQDEQ